MDVKGENPLTTFSQKEVKEIGPKRF